MSWQFEIHVIKEENGVSWEHSARHKPAILKEVLSNYVENTNTDDPVKKSTVKPGVVGLVFNSSYLGGRGRRICG
jgi:hypothetical protein